MPVVEAGNADPWKGHGIVMVMTGVGVDPWQEPEKDSEGRIRDTFLRRPESSRTTVDIKGK